MIYTWGGKPYVQTIKKVIKVVLPKHPGQEQVRVIEGECSLLYAYRLFTCYTYNYIDNHFITYCYYYIHPL